MLGAGGRIDSLEVPTLVSDQTLRNQSIISLDGFRPSSPLSFHGFLAEKEMLYELAEAVQIDGTKVIINLILFLHHAAS